MKYSIPMMKKQGFGCFITTSSVAGFQQGLGGLPYSLSKAGIIQLTRIAAVELGAFGIRANAIAPGGIATGIFGQAFGLSPDVAVNFGESIKDILAIYQPIRRAGLPEDIANAALFLAEDTSSFITGITLKVDGGLLSGRVPQDPEDLMEKYFNIITQLDPEDQKILTSRIQESTKKLIENMKYMTPIAREQTLKGMQKLAKKQQELMKGSKKK